MHLIAKVGRPVRVRRLAIILLVLKRSSIRLKAFCFPHSIYLGRYFDGDCIACSFLFAVFEDPFLQSSTLFHKNCRKILRGLLLYSKEQDFEKTLPCLLCNYRLYTETQKELPSISVEADLFLLCVAGSLRRLLRRV